MKCYNHPDRDAVATCQNCGKNLCKECADKYRPCLCDDCYKVLRQKEKDDLKTARIELLKTFGIAIIITVIACYITLKVIGPQSRPPLSLVLPIAFFAPFGWKYANLLGFNWAFNINIGGFILMIFVYSFRAIIAAALGVFCFIAAIIKYVRLVCIERSINIEMKDNK